MKTRRAFSLIESVSSMAVLSLVMIAVFYLFDFGRQQFALGLMRTGFHNDIRMVTTTLSRDIKLASLDGFQLDTPRSSNFDLNGKSYTASRQSLCFPTLKDWSDGTAQYDNQSGLPIYNEYIIWVCSGHLPAGNLYRIELNAPGNQGKPMNAGSFAAATTSIFGGIGPGVTNYGGPKYTIHRTMARSVTHMTSQFKSVVDQQTHVEVTFRFLGEARSSVTRDRTESTEIIVRAAPGNHATNN